MEPDFLLRNWNMKHVYFSFWVEVGILNRNYPSGMHIHQEFITKKVFKQSFRDATPLNSW